MFVLLDSPLLTPQQQAQAIQKAVQDALDNYISTHPQLPQKSFVAVMNLAKVNATLEWRNADGSSLFGNTIAIPANDFLLVSNDDDPIKAASSMALQSAADCFIGFSSYDAKTHQSAILPFNYDALAANTFKQYAIAGLAAIAVILPVAANVVTQTYSMTTIANFTGQDLYIYTAGLGADGQPAGAPKVLPHKSDTTVRKTDLSGTIYAGSNSFYIKAGNSSLYPLWAANTDDTPETEPYGNDFYNVQLGPNDFQACTISDFTNCVYMVGKPANLA